MERYINSQGQLTLFLQPRLKITGGSWNPLWSRSRFQPLGSPSPSSYSAGSHLTKAVLAAPQRGFCLTKENHEVCPDTPQRKKELCASIQIIQTG